MTDDTTIRQLDDLYLSGLDHYRNHRYRLAQEQFQDIIHLRLDKSYLPLKNSVQFLLAECCEKEGYLPEAETWYTMVQMKSPLNSSLHELASSALERLAARHSTNLSKTLK